MTTNLHTPIANGANADAVVFNGPLGQLDEAVTKLNVGFPPILNDLRLSLAAGYNPVPTADITGATTLYLTFYKGNKITLYDSGWKIFALTAEISISLTGLLANTIYDVFAYPNAGSVAMEFLAWNNSGAGTSARVANLTLYEGIKVKPGDASRRYLGSLITGSAGQCTSSSILRGLWNAHNQVRLPFERSSSSSHGYTVATWREWGGDPAFRVGFVCGDVAEVLVSHQAALYSFGQASVALDVVNNDNLGIGIHNNSAASIRMGASKALLASAGYHNLQAVELGTTGSTFASLSILGGING